MQYVEYRKENYMKPTPPQIGSVSTGNECGRGFELYLFERELEEFFPYITSSIATQLLNINTWKNRNVLRDVIQQLVNFTKKKREDREMKKLDSEGKAFRSSYEEENTKSVMCFGYILLKIIPPGHPSRRPESSIVNMNIISKFDESEL
jgi:hypothetical protein